MILLARIAGVALLASCSVLAAAQDKEILGTSKIPAPTQRVTAADVAPVSVAAGQTAHVDLAFRVASGYHINSNQPKSELLLPTVLLLSPPTDVSVGKMVYPPGEDLGFSFAPEEKLNVYTGDFNVRALVSPARTAPPGTYRVRGTLKYQACDNRACYPPGQLPVAFDVKVTKAAASARKRPNPPQSPHVHP